MSPIHPPATIGLLGGGQLGRMTALAARAAGYRLHALDPDPQCATRSLVDEFIAAGFDDAEAAGRLAKGCQVVTFEIEKVSVKSLEAASRYAPVRPGPALLELVQNRLRQKVWLSCNGFPLGQFRRVGSLADLQQAHHELGRCFLKVAEGGYDGRGQVILESAESVPSAWQFIGELESVAEKALDLEYEISVLVARRPGGETVVYAPSMNHHENQILVWALMPAPIPESIALQAQQIARELASALQLEGILVVEMFVTRQGELLVNELAPRPHNSYHASERACITGQFEQLTRAICDVPLGAADVIRPAAIVNLLGDLWMGPTPIDFSAALRVREARFHFYDKAPRPGRKMGHISATGPTAKQALEAALQAKSAMTAAPKQNRAWAELPAR